jgi:hypothetical protein
MIAFSGIIKCVGATGCGLNEWLQQIADQRSTVGSGTLSGFEAFVKISQIIVENLAN